MLTIRPINEQAESDYVTLAMLNNTIEVDEQLTAVMLRQHDKERVPVYALFAKRYIAEANGRCVGGARIFQSKDDADRWHFSMQVHPDFQFGDVPARLQAYLINEIESHEPKKITTEPKEDEQYRIDLLNEFEQKMRFPRSRIDVTTADLSEYARLQKRLNKQDIRFVTLTDVMKQDAHWQDHIWRLFNHIYRDIPSPDLFEEMPFEDYAQYYRGDSFRPDSWAIATDTTASGLEQYVGMAVVNLVEKQPNALFAGVTGTVRSYRRRKIATVLKMQTIRYAQEHGYTYIYTDNEENNPMFDLNLQLGFKRLPAWVYYERRAR